MADKQVEIKIVITGDSSGAKNVVGALEKSFKDIPGEAKKASTGLSGAFKTGLATIRKDFNDAFKVGLGNVLADGLRGATQTIKTFAKESGEAFLSYEKALTGVAKTTGIEGENLENLSEKLRQSAIDLKALGEGGAEQLVSIAEIAGQLGVAQDKIEIGKFAEASDEIGEFAEVIAKGKIAMADFPGGIEGIATTTAKTIQLFGMTATEAENILSTYNGLSDATAATAGEIATFVQSFNLAPQLKISMEESAGIAATLISLGQDANAGATRFQAALQNLTNDSKRAVEAVNTALEGSNNAQERLEQIVGESKKTTESWRDFFLTAMSVDAVGAVTALVDGIGEIEKTTDRSKVATDAFGREGARAMNTLIGNTEKLNTNIEKSKTLFEENKSLQAEFDKVLQQQGVVFSDLATRVDDIKLTIGEDLVNAIADVGKAEITPILDDFQEWLEKSEEARVLFETTLPGAISGAVAVISELVQGLNTIHTAIVDLAKVTGTWIGELGQVEEAFDPHQAAEDFHDLIEAYGETISESNELTEAAEKLRDMLFDATQDPKKATQELFLAFKDLKQATEAAASGSGEFDKKMGELTASIKAADDALEGRSLTPALKRYVQQAVKSEEETNALSDSMVQMGKDILEAEKAFKVTAKTIRENQAKVRDLDSEIGRLNTKIRDLNDEQKEEKKVLKDLIKERQREKTEIQNTNRALANEQAERKALISGLSDEIRLEKIVIEEKQKLIKTTNDLSDAYENAGNKVGSLGGKVEKLGRAAASGKAEFEESKIAVEDFTGVLSQAINVFDGFLDLDLSKLQRLTSGVGQLGSDFSSLQTHVAENEDALNGLNAASLQSASSILAISAQVKTLISDMLGLDQQTAQLVQTLGLLPGLLASLTGLFDDNASQGNKSAEAFRKFVESNIEGGDEMSEALAQAFQDMKEAGFDFQTFLEETETTMDQTFGGMSENWQEGTTALDLFTQAIGAATGDMEKAPQIALQMLAAFEDMGLSAEEAAQKMIEIAEASGFTDDALLELQERLALQLLESLEDLGLSADETVEKMEEIAEATGLTEEQLAALQEQLEGLSEQQDKTTQGIEHQKDALRELSEQGDRTTQSIQELAEAEEKAKEGADKMAEAADGNAEAMKAMEQAALEASGGVLILGATAESVGEQGSQGIEQINNALEDTGEGARGADDAVTSLGRVIEQLPRERTVRIKVEKEGNVPELASGGTVFGGLALVGEKGKEGFKTPSGITGLVGLRGPELAAFPDGTQIIPNHQLASFIAQNPGLPKMANGGTISTGQTFVANISGNNFYGEMDLRKVVRDEFETLARKINSTR
jgi:TP901 family phage tail tape measure protein